MHVLNIAAYKFVNLDELPTLRIALKARAIALKIRGTILLSTEGINIMLAGEPSAIKNYQAYLATDNRFADLHYKESYSAELTFNRLLVKIKKEIIALGLPEINPSETRAPSIKPVELKQWLDEKREIILLDARNNYEVNLGTFIGAKELGITHFRDFPQALEKLAPDLKDKTIVTFCTGGIRCEKAALVMAQHGFKQVLQLEGGILDYFVSCGSAHYQGECFVFDRRVGVNPQLEETGTIQCFACLHPVSLAEQQDPSYITDISCPHCVKQR